jgi:co-chaperonin GroES (HSP10)
LANFRPLGDRVLVKRVKEEEKTRGGIIIPETAQEKPQEGEVVAVGPGARDEDGERIEMDVKVGERILFGKPLAATQITQTKLADCFLEFEKGVLLSHHIGKLKDSGTLTHDQVSVGKLNNVREAVGIVSTVRSILGGNGVTADYPIMRHMMNLESVRTYEGTDEVHALVVGRALTGEDAFR